MKKYIKIFLFILFEIFLAMQIVTQYVASVLKYQEALTYSIMDKIYYPWAIILWSYEWQDPNLQDLSEIAFYMFQVIIGVIFLLHIIIIESQKNKMSANERLHGSARWAVEKDLNDAGITMTPNSNSVVVGGIEIKGKVKPLYHSGPEHVNTVAPTRSGKGVGLVIPTLTTWTPSAVIADLKGELYQITAGWRKKYAKNKIIKFEPAAKNSDRWNPIQEIRIGTEYETADAQNIATIIVDPDGKGLEDHWQKSAQALLSGLIIHAIYKRKKEENKPASMSYIDNLLSDPTRPISELFEEMMTFEHTEEGAIAISSRVGRTMSDTPEQERGSIISTAKSFLSLYRDPIVAENTEESDFNIIDIMNSENPISLYLVTQPPDKDRLKPLMRIFLNMFVRVNASKMNFERVEHIKKKSILNPFGKNKKNTEIKASGNYKHRCLLMIDELPSFGRLAILEESLAFIAGYGMKAYLISQDMNQLKKAYGDKETITANCHVQNAYAPNKPETAEYLSKLCGETTIVTKKVSISGTGILKQKNRSISLNETKRPLMTVDEVLRIQGPIKSDSGEIKMPGKMLLFIAGFPAFLGTQVLFFQNEIFSARTSVPLEQDNEIKLEKIKL